MLYEVITNETKPPEIPSGDLDFKPSPRKSADLDVQSRMPKFALPASVADVKLYSFRATGQPVQIALSQLATAYVITSYSIHYTKLYDVDRDQQFLQCLLASYNFV